MDTNLNARIASRINSSKELPKTTIVQRPGVVGDFGAILKKELESKTSGQLKFSKHATERLAQRDISVDSSLYNKLDEVVSTAQQKGIKEMVILNEKNAFVVSVPNKTVITTMNGNEMKNNIFTNIDGAVII